MAENRIQIVIQTNASGAVTGIRQVGSELDRMGSSGARSGSRVNASMQLLAAGCKALGAAIAAIGIERLARELLETAMALDTMRNKLKFALGGSAQAQNAVGFLREESKRLGLNMLSAADSLGSFAAAARGTALEGQASKEVFLAIAEATTVMGLSNEEATGAMTALTQIMSKGKVQAEELRGQLGERLPGAFQIAARAMGMTTQELDKFMADGKLTAESFLPKFAAQLRSEMAGSVGEAGRSTRSELNRLQNAWTELEQAMLEMGFLSAITAALQGAAGAAGLVGAQLKKIKELLENWPQIGAGIFPGMIGGTMGFVAGVGGRTIGQALAPGGPSVRKTAIPRTGGLLNTSAFDVDPESAILSGMVGMAELAKTATQDAEKVVNTLIEKSKPAWEEYRQNLEAIDRIAQRGEKSPERIAQARAYAYQQYEKAMQPKGAGKGGAGASPIDIEAIDRDILQFREKMQKLYSELEDLDSEYRADQLERSGRAYDAEAERLDRQAAKRKEAFAREVADAEQAYLEMEQKLSGRRGGTAEAWAHLAELKTKYDDLKKAAQEYGDKVDRNLQLTKDVKKAEDDAGRAEDLARINLEYGKLTGTMQEQLALQILLLRAEKDKKLLAVDPELRTAYERLYAEQERLLRLQRDGSMFDGMIEGMRQFQREIPTAFDAGKAVIDSFKQGIDSAADALAEFTMIGKMNFTDFANSVIRDIMKMFYRMMLMKMFGGIFDLLGFGGGSGGSIAPGAADWFKTGGNRTSAGIAGGIGGFGGGGLPVSLQRPGAGQRGSSAGINTTINVHVPAGATPADTDAARRMGTEIGRAVKADWNKNLQEQLRNGGLLNRGITV